MASLKADRSIPSMAHVPTGPQLALTMLQERSTGTFAKVYLAEARGPDGLSRIVAVKVLKEQWLESEELIRRTRDEAMLLARLRHKNILRVEAMTEIDQRPAIVMEFVDGVDLGQLIEAKDGAITAFPPRAAYRIAMETASALHAAWARVPYGLSEPLQVVHRDIKPPNIMISESPRPG
jgi:serine/threonine protein kinase